MTTFWIVAGVLTLIALLAIAIPIWRWRRSSSDVLVLTLVLLLIPAVAVPVYMSVTNYQPDAPTTAPPVEDLTAQLEQRLGKSPDDLEGWLLLGRTYISMQRFPEGLTAYRQAYRLAGDSNSEVALGFAEAQILVDRGTMSGDAGMLIETVLQREPDNLRALLMGGLVALAKGQSAVAVSRWTHLLQLEPPEQLRTLVQQQLAALTGQTPPAAAANTAAITVRVALSPELQSQLDPGLPLFIFARDPAAAGGPPLAVVRRTAGELPIEIQLSDADRMIAGKSLADFPRLRIVARVSRSGTPAAGPGDLTGEAVIDVASRMAEVVINTKMD